VRFDEVAPASGWVVPRHVVGGPNYRSAVSPALDALRYYPADHHGVTGLVDRILGLPGWLVLVVAGLVVFAEDALFVGFVLPGETAPFLAGAAAKIGHASLPAVIIVVIVAAIVGDTVGYEIAPHGGTRVLGGACSTSAANRWTLPRTSWPAAAAAPSSSAAGSRSSARSCRSWPARRGCTTRSSWRTTRPAASPGAPRSPCSATPPAPPARR
jgi:hypothetical protein